LEVRERRGRRRGRRRGKRKKEKGRRGKAALGADVEESPST